MRNVIRAAKWLGLLLCLSGGMASAAEAPPSEASLRELLEVTRARQLVDNIIEQMDGMLQSSMRDALQGRPLTDEQQRILGDFRGRVVQLFAAEMKWDQLEPQFLDIYRTTFTQSEVDGMVAFYRTEPGRAVIGKMPVVLQRSMSITTRQLQSLEPKLLELQREVVEKMRATEPQASPAPPPGPAGPAEGAQP